MFPGVDGVFHIVRGAHLFGLSIDNQAGLELEAVVVVVAAAAVRNGSKFSQCNVVWRGFPWARRSECQKFEFGWYFIST
jgi:hypothetical protein